MLRPPDWKFNPSLTQTKQFPLFFTNPYIDTISRSLTAFGCTQTQRILYMGPRYTSSTKILKASATNNLRDDNQVENSQIYGKEEINKYQFVFNQKQRFYPSRSSQYRLFNGMNPTAKKTQLRFDSNFQCGNLDLVVSLGKNQYDLFMRVDSNTKGHTCWFFFKVDNFTDHQRAKFNIVNFSRGSLMYGYGLKIYMYCSSSKNWEQGGQKIEFGVSESCKYIEIDYEDDNQRYTLSFQYEFKMEDQFVYFAYCIPYSYSYLLHNLTEIQKKYYRYVELDLNNTSTGGLSLPVLTITNKNSNIINLQSEEIKKQTCLIIGRLHPGQTQASWLIHGFINYLCSNKAHQIRNKTIFKIIPMVNVDGVVAGNFRTGLLGRDLNRFFHQPQLINEVGLIRSLAAKYHPTLFLDFHGHSSKKNIFTYGPDYGIDHRYFLTSRLFSKLVSKSCKPFRYYACQFRIPNYKKTTGRSIMLRNHSIPYCYTFEASAFAYGQKKQEALFDMWEYEEAGSSIGMGVDRFLKLIALPSKREILKGKSKNVKKAVNFEEASLSTEDKVLLQEVMTEQKQRKTLDCDKNGEDSDFEENNDYSEKELNRMLSDPMELTFMKKRKVEAKRHNRFASILNQDQRQIHSETTQKSLKLSSVIKLTEPDEESGRAALEKKLVKRITKSPEIGKAQSESLHLNIESFPADNTNKIRINLSKKIFSQDSCIIMEQPRSKARRNQIIIDCGINKTTSEYQPFSEMKRAKERQTAQRRQRQKIAHLQRQKLAVEQQKQKMRLEDRRSNTRFQKEGRVEIKHSILPMLGRSGNMSKDESSLLLNEILENHQRSKSNRVSKNIKMYYY